MDVAAAPFVRKAESPARRRVEGATGITCGVAVAGTRDGEFALMRPLFASAGPLRERMKTG
jgi:hypothetical protein